MFYKKNLLSLFRSYIVILLLLLSNFFLVIIPLKAEDECGKIIVGVKLNIVDKDKFVKFLNTKYPEQPAGSWMYQIKNKILSELRDNSPDIEFTMGSKEADYSFEFDLSLIAAGEDIKAGGVRIAEFTAFLISSQLKQNNGCGFSGYVVGANQTNYNAPEEIIKDLFRVIEYHIDSYGSISGKIKEFEKTHRVPPRIPKLLISLSKQYVSPLKEEREIEIKIQVKNCKNELVFDRNRGQIVLLPRKTSRGEIKPTPRFPQGVKVTDNLVMLFINKPEGASATYTLKKGMELFVDTLKVETCGKKRRVVKEVMIPIAGLGLKVKPENVYVFPEEKTKINVELIKRTPTGKKEFVSGKKIFLSVKGLKDGKISPVGNVQLNKGKVVMNYSAGAKDEAVYVNAKFQPQGYSDSLKEGASVAVIEKGYEWAGWVNVDEVCNFEKKEKGDNKSESITYKHKLHLSIVFMSKPGGPDIIRSGDVFGTAIYKLSTFFQSKEAACTPKGGTGVVYKRPGGWERTEIIVKGDLIKKKLKVYPMIHINRLKDEYEFKFGVSGLYWKSMLSRKDVYYSACNGKTKEENYTSPSPQVKSFDMENLYYKGHTISLKKLTGNKVVKRKIPWNCTTTYHWSLERIKK